MAIETISTTDDAVEAKIPRIYVLSICLLFDLFSIHLGVSVVGVSE